MLGTKTYVVYKIAPPTLHQCWYQSTSSTKFCPSDYINADTKTDLVYEFVPPRLYYCRKGHSAKNCTPKPLSTYSKEQQVTIESYALVLHKILGPNVRMLRMSRIQEILYKKALVLTDFIEEIPWRMRNPKSISRPKKAATPTNSHPHMKDFNVQEGGQTKAATPTNTH